MDTANSLHHAKTIQRRTGRTFYIATLLLPRQVRRATHILYAFFRLADDVVDDPDPVPPAEQRVELGRLCRGALGWAETDDPVLVGVCELRGRSEIPEYEIARFVAAMVQDIDPPRYDTTEELSGYLRGSSVAVANMMLAVMSREMSEDDLDRARPHAKSMAEALQLTNFLRDVREDVRDYDRIYLPHTVLERNGVSEEQIRALEFSPGFADAIREELERTESRYAHGVDGIQHLPEDCRFGVLIAATLYADHHRLIRQQGYDVLSSRPTLTIPRRLLILARTWWHWRRTGDPRLTFEAVTDFESPSTRPESVDDLDTTGGGYDSPADVVELLRTRLCWRSSE